MSGHIVSTLHDSVHAKGIERASPCFHSLTKQRTPHTTNCVLLVDLVGLLGVDVKSKISRNTLVSEMTESERSSLTLDEANNNMIVMSNWLFMDNIFMMHTESFNQATLT